jgi:hypothetical protein
VEERRLKLRGSHGVARIAAREASSTDSGSARELFPVPDNRQEGWLIDRAHRAQRPCPEDRFHARRLRTPREMRTASVCVLDNGRKHISGARGLDPRSSAGWFDGWTSPPGAPPGSSPVASACTWLARIGWTRGGGRIRVDDTPRRS